MTRLGCLVFCLWLVAPISTFARSAIREALTKEKIAREAASSANYPVAIENFQMAAAVYRENGLSDREDAILRQLSGIWSKTSNLNALIAVMLRRLELAKSAHSLNSVAVLYSQLGDAYLKIPQDAGKGQETTAAEAAEAYVNGAEAAARLGQPGSETRMLCNAAISAGQAGNAKSASQFLSRAMDSAARVTNENERRWSQVVVGGAWRMIGDTQQASAILEKTSSEASGAKDSRSISYAEGYLGGIAEKKREWDAALAHTNKAILAALQSGDSSAVYQWQWQLGRIHRSLGNLNESIQAYAVAVAAADRTQQESVRVSQQEMPLSPPGDVHLGYADLLMARSHAETGPDKEADLLKARSALIRRHQSELKAYYQDDCAYVQRPNEVEPDTVSNEAVLLYPVFLPDRVEVIYSRSGRLGSYIVPVSPDEFRAQIKSFRQLLEKRTTLEYEAPALLLYQYLIDPLEQRIPTDGVKTLVIVPDGPLHGIPFAALRKGNQFLIQRYAVATSPGLKLSPEKSSVRRAGRIQAALLAAGLSTQKAPFPALTYVPMELDSAEANFRQKSKLRNDEFELARLEAQYRRRDYAVVHIASHATFAPGASASVIVTSKGPPIGISEMDVLLDKSGQTKPLDLIVLSACETAIGDDLAALGLGGIAVEAGAKSAVGTLWHINDKAASELIKAFYSKLFEPGFNKAQALQFAQEQFLSDPWLRHPAYWAAFLLINDWR